MVHAAGTASENQRPWALRDGRILTDYIAGHSKHWTGSQDTWALTWPLSPMSHVIRVSRFPFLDFKF